MLPIQKGQLLMGTDNEKPKDGADEVPQSVSELETSTHKYIHASTSEELYTNLTPKEIREFNKAKELSQNLTFGYRLFISIVTIIFIFVSNYFVNIYLLWMAKKIQIPDQYLPTLELILRGFTILLSITLAISTLSAQCMQYIRGKKNIKPFFLIRLRKKR
jgi:hypothetical protein